MCGAHSNRETQGKCVSRNFFKNFQKNFDFSLDI
nr:MAG TPA: hypothetical protein [Caudoviricetes sp.]